MRFIMKCSRIRISIACLLSLIVMPLTTQAENKEQQSVYIAAIIEHPALDNVKQGVIDELMENGYVNGGNINLRYQSAQGSMANLAQIAKLFVSEKPTVMVALATPTAQTLAANTKTIPIVFTAVTDPVSAKLVSNWKASDSNITGVSDKLDIAAQIDMIKRIKPDAKRVGFIYNPSEVNSTQVLKELNQLLPKNGLSLVAVAASKTSDLPTAAMSLKGRVDIIYSNNDNTVMSGYESLVKVADAYHIPLLASDPDAITRGATVAYGMSYYDLGRQTGKLVIDILKGENAGKIAPEIGKKMELALNKKVAKKQLIVFSPDLLESASTIIEE